MKALSDMDSSIVIEGVGGENMRNAGVKLFEDHSKMSSVGLSPQIIINHIILGKKLVDYLKNEYKPDAVLMIDYGGFNIRIAGFLNKMLMKFYAFFHLKKSYTKAMV